MFLSLVLLQHILFFPSTLCYETCAVALAEEAEVAISSDKLDAVAFGVPFLANPDLPARFAKKAPLNAPNPAKFYSAGAEGYTDYPYLAA